MSESVGHAANRALWQRLRFLSNSSRPSRRERDNIGETLFVLVTFHFEEFSLDVHSRLLTAGHRTIPLTPKAFDLLVLLLDAQPRVVPKAELHQRLWPGT